MHTHNHDTTNADDKKNTHTTALSLVPEEGRAEGAQLVDEAAQGPDVRGVVVGPAAPDLGAHVVRRADLRLLGWFVFVWFCFHFGGWVGL
jgi:hypothetical protein